MLAAAAQTALLLPLTILIRFRCFALFKRPLQLLSVRAAVDLDQQDQVPPCEAKAEPAAALNLLLGCK